MNKKIVVGGAIVLILVVLGIVLGDSRDITPVNGRSQGITVKEIEIPNSFGAPIFVQTSGYLVTVLFEGGFTMYRVNENVRYVFVYTDES